MRLRVRRHRSPPERVSAYTRPAPATTRLPFARLDAASQQLVWRDRQLTDALARGLGDGVRDGRGGADDPDLGPPISAASASGSRHGRCATPPSAMRALEIVSPSIASATATDSYRQGADGVSDRRVVVAVRSLL
jgi:hypothetical protein